MTDIALLNTHLRWRSRGYRLKARSSYCPNCLL